MDIESAIKVLEDASAQAKQLGPQFRQRILSLAESLPTLVLSHEQLAFKHIMEVSQSCKRKYPNLGHSD
jgi:hypothetical protein